MLLENIRPKARISPSSFGWRSCVNTAIMLFYVHVGMVRVDTGTPYKNTTTGARVKASKNQSTVAVSSQHGDQASLLRLVLYNRLLQWVVTRLHKSQQMALSLASLYTVSPTFHAVGSDYFNPFMGTCNYNATSNNMKLVHWSLIGGLLHLAHQGRYWPQPAQAPPRCTKCNSPPINGQCTNHRISV